MKLLISDANILIDFEEGGLVDALFGLEARLAVPDVLFEDELKEAHPHFEELGLESIELGPVAVHRAVELARAHRRPGRIDLLALALAEQEACPLLTGDRDLRDAANAEGVEVHGTLWVAALLLDAGLVTASELRAAYQAMRAASRRLPWSLVDDQLRRLGLPPLE